MAIIKCTECGKEVSDKAEICPNCGYNIAQHLQEEKERLEREEREKQLEIEKKERKKEIKELCHKLFGSKKKKIIWICIFIFMLLACTLAFLYTRKIAECKKYANSLWSSYTKIDGHLLDTSSIGNMKKYNIDAYDLYGAVCDLELMEISYKKMSTTQQKIFDNWFTSTYSMNTEQLKSKLAEYHIGDKNYDISAYTEYLNDYRQSAKKEEADKIKIVEDSLVADGEYYYYTGKIQNNTNDTVSYIKYTIYIYNEDGDLENSDWSNWTGTLKPNATIMVDTMIKRYDTEHKKFKAVIDEYNYK